MKIPASPGTHMVFRLPSLWDSGLSALGSVNVQIPGPHSTPTESESAGGTQESSLWNK